MNKIDKIKKTIAGDTVSEVPLSFWTHLPEYDRQPEALARETYAIYKKYDLDFIKTMNSGMYPVEDYETEIDYSKIEKGGVAELVASPIKENGDWEKLPALSIDKGVFERELSSLKNLVELVDGEAPIIFTVFSPLTIADKLAQGDLSPYISAGNDSLHQALATIAETNAQLAAKAVELGAAGVYFASQQSSANKVSSATYEEYGVPYDRQVLAGAKEGWFNALHIHGTDIYFDLLKDYPVDVINWHIWETLPEIKEGQDFSGKTIMGGIARGDVTNNNRDKIRNQIYRSIKETQGKKLILTPGCSIRYPINEQTLAYIKETKEEVEKRLLQ